MRVHVASPPVPRRLWTTGGALLLAAVAAGCGAPSGGAGPDHKPSAPPTSHAPRTPAPGPTTSRPSPSAPSASDGTRYAACADGTCEVAVSRPVDIAVDGGTLSVTKVRPPSSLAFELTLANGGGGSGTLKGTCGSVLTFSPGGGGISATTCGANSTPTPPSPEPGALSMQLAGWDDGAAVLRLASG